MEKACIFRNNKSQAVRLPKNVALPDDIKQVAIIPLGRARLITPVGEAWDTWFDGDNVSDDFMENLERRQPFAQTRDDFS